MAAGEYDINLGPVDRTMRCVVLAAGGLNVPARQVFIFGNDVGDDTHRAAVIGQAFAQNDAGAILDHRCFDGAVEQQAATTGPVGRIGFLNLAAAEENAVAAGQAGMLAGHVNQVSDQFGDRRLAMRAGDANQRHAATQALGKEVVDDGLADRARLANARFDVHQQAGAGVDFNDGAALLG